MTEASDEVPDWASTAFWVLVLVFNVAVFFTAVGGMVLYFEGDLVLSGIMFAIGGVAWVVGLGGYGITRQKLPD